MLKRLHCFRHHQISLCKSVTQLKLISNRIPDSLLRYIFTSNVVIPLKPLSNPIKIISVKQAFQILTCLVYFKQSRVKLLIQSTRHAAFDKVFTKMICIEFAFLLGPIPCQIRTNTSKQVCSVFSRWILVKYLWCRLALYSW